MKTHPLQFVIFGILILIFGIVDLWLLNPYFGILLTIGGIWLTFYGIQRVRQSKKR